MDNETGANLSANNEETVAGEEYIIEFKEDVSFVSIKEILKPYQYSLLGQSSERIFSVQLPSYEEFYKNYSGSCVYIEKEQKRTLAAIPNDTYYNSQWALPTMNLPAAWDVTKGTNAVKVAVIDTGIYRQHEDFVGTNILAGWNCYTNASVVTGDDDGHGTMVTSVIAATTNNNIGIAGACWNWNVTIVPYKVDSPDGYIYTEELIRAILFAADAGCDVINMSLGGYYGADPAEQEAINYAVNKGCIVVASSGNAGYVGSPDRGSLSYPASYDGVISVAAINSSTQRAYFSQYNNKVDVTAPGENISVLLKNSPTSYDIASGTSFSSPYVAAVAALARTFEKNINATYFEELLKRTSTDLGAASRDDDFGWGLVNAKAIVDIAKFPIVLGAENNKIYSTAVTLSFNKGTATLNGTPFANGASVSNEGFYKLIVTDSNGNQTTTKFTIGQNIIYSVTPSVLVNRSIHYIAT